MTPRTDIDGVEFPRAGHTIASTLPTGIPHPIATVTSPPRMLTIVLDEFTAAQLSKAIDAGAVFGTSEDQDYRLYRNGEVLTQFARLARVIQNALR